MTITEDLEEFSDAEQIVANIFMDNFADETEVWLNLKILEGFEEDLELWINGVLISPPHNLVGLQWTPADSGGLHQTRKKST